MSDYKVVGLSPEAVDKQWSGTGWTDKTSKTYRQWEAEAIAREISQEGEFIAWTEEI